MKLKAYLPEILAGLSLLVIIFLIIQRKILDGYWFRPYGSWHHETVEVCLLAFAIGLLVSSYLERAGLKNRLPLLLAGLAVLVALLLPVHQKLVNDFWFSLRSIWHREAVEGYFFALGAGLLLSKYLGSKDLSWLILK